MRERGAIIARAERARSAYVDVLLLEVLDGLVRLLFLRLLLEVQIRLVEGLRILLRCEKNAARRAGSGEC